MKILRYLTVLIKLVCPKAAELDKNINRKNTNAAPPRGTLLRTEEKNPAPGRNQTHDLSVTRRALYRFATTTAHNFFKQWHLLLLSKRVVQVRSELRLKGLLKVVLSRQN